MMSLDEIFLPSLEGEFGFNPWPAPAPAPSPSPSPSPSPAPTACPEEPDQATLSPAEERRRRRRISNRESARRSRMRKQRHLEELQSQATLLISEKQFLTDRLVDVFDRCLHFRRDNDRLRAESAALRCRLSEIRRLLVLQQLRLRSSPQPPVPAAAAAACGGFCSPYEQTLASLITPII